MVTSCGMTRTSHCALHLGAWTTLTLTLLYIALMASPVCEAIQYTHWYWGSSQLNKTNYNPTVVPTKILQKRVMMSCFIVQLIHLEVLASSPWALEQIRGATNIIHINPIYIPLTSIGDDHKENGQWMGQNPPRSKARGTSFGDSFLPSSTANRQIPTTLR